MTDYAAAYRAITDLLGADIVNPHDTSGRFALSPYITVYGRAYTVTITECEQCDIEREHLRVFGGFGGDDSFICLGCGHVDMDAYFPQPDWVVARRLERARELVPTAIDKALYDAVALFPYHFNCAGSSAPCAECQRTIEVVRSAR